MNKIGSSLLLFLSIIFTSNVMAAEDRNTQKADMSKRVLYRLGALWDPASGDILARGFTMQDRNNWFESIKELQAYLKKTRSSLASPVYVELFNNYINELEQASIDLFNAVQLIFNSQIQSKTIAEADLVLLKTEYDKLKAHEKKMQELSKQLGSKKFTDLKSTKEIKKMFLMVLKPFEAMYQKVLEEISAIRSVVRLKFDVEKTREAARKNAQEKNIFG